MCWFCSLCRSQWGFFLCLHLSSSLITGRPSCVCLSPRSLSISLSLSRSLSLCCLCSCVAALTQHSESVRSRPAPPLCSPRLLLCVSTLSFSMPPAHTHTHTHTHSHTHTHTEACVYLCESRALTHECFVFYTLLKVHLKVNMKLKPTLFIDLIQVSGLIVNKSAK